MPAWSPVAQAPATGGSKPLPHFRIQNLTSVQSASNFIIEQIQQVRFFTSKCPRNPGRGQHFWAEWAPYSWLHRIWLFPTGASRFLSLSSASQQWPLWSSQWVHRSFQFLRTVCSIVFFLGFTTRCSLGQLLPSPSTATGRIVLRPVPRTAAEPVGHGQDTSAQSLTPLLSQRFRVRL